LIYGALASATAPAGTVEVIREYKAKGDLTSTLYGVMGLDDIFALLLYSLTAPVAIMFINGGAVGPDHSVLVAVSHAVLEIVKSVGIGALVGVLLIAIGRYLKDWQGMLFLTLGMILLNCGLSEMLDLSPILLNMATGIVTVNMDTSTSRKMIEGLQNWAPPLYVLFFVLVGCHLDLQLLQEYWLIVALYILARSSGKWGGAFVGGKVAKAPANTQKYLGLALFSQAGVAIALAYNASKALKEAGLGLEAEQVLSVIAATTFVVMLLGPVFAKTALVKSGEATEGH
jgi:Kef-type K+ transport system membrane component KefB